MYYMHVSELRERGNSFKSACVPHRRSPASTRRSAGAQRRPTRATMRGLLVLAAAVPVQGYDPRKSHGPVECQGEPADNFQPCYASRCCSTAGFDCFKSANRTFAQCLPLVRHQGDGDAAGAGCVDSQQWLCPDSWRPPHPPPQPPPPPVPATTRATSCAPNKEPSAAFSGCFESRCCQGSATASAGFGCFKKPDRNCKRPLAPVLSPGPASCMCLHPAGLRSPCARPSHTHILPLVS